MKQQDTPISPLRQRMIEDMSMRKLRKDTQRDYIRSVKKLEHFLNKPLTAATREDLRRFQLYLIESKTSPATLNAIVSGCLLYTSDAADDLLQV